MDVIKISEGVKFETVRCSLCGGVIPPHFNTATLLDQDTGKRATVCNYCFCALTMNRRGTVDALVRYFKTIPGAGNNGGAK